MKVQAEYLVVGVGAGEVARHEDAERQARPRHHLALARLQAHDLKYGQCLEAGLGCYESSTASNEGSRRFHNHREYHYQHLDVKSLMIFVSTSQFRIYFGFGWFMSG